MPTVRELSALYENVMLGPRRGPDVCGTCFNFTDGYERCYACAHGQPVLDAVAPISYSVAREQLHHALASYKRLHGDVARRLGASLAAILWRFLAEHETVRRRARPGRDAVRRSSRRSRRATARATSTIRCAGSSASSSGRPATATSGCCGASDVDVRPRAFSAEKFVATRPIERRAGAADRRHVDDRRQRPERRRGA